jgi:hypothetical protein
MSLNTALEIAIVLAGIYVTLSCLVSWIQEQIATFLRLRGETLYQGILGLIYDEVGLAEALFTHPLLTSGARGHPLDRRTTVRPSYVDARNFSLAFWQIVHASQGGGQNVPAAPTGFPPETLVWKVASSSLTIPPTLIADLRTTVGAMRATPQLQQVLTALLVAADEDYDKLLTATDAWFEAQMDRVSGWYKRRTQWVIVAIALLVVSFSGVDSINVVRGLAGDSSLLHAAANGLSTHPNSAFDLTPYTNVTLAFWTNWRAHWAGMLITLVALSLGGPFWFQALCTLVNVRNAGSKPSSTSQA